MTHHPIIPIGADGKLILSKQLIDQGGTYALYIFENNELGRKCAEKINAKFKSR